MTAIRRNESYDIIREEVYSVTPINKRSIVFGKNRFTSEYVTWECDHITGTDKYNYFWGHYFNEQQYLKAMEDYYERLAQQYRLI